MHVGNVVRIVGLRIELSRCVVSASVLVLGEDVFHAVVVEEVGGVVVVVEVFVAPEMAFQEFVGLDTAGANGVFARVISILWIASWYEVRHGGFAVAECGAQIVAVRAGDWSFADEAGNVIRC